MIQQQPKIISQGTYGCIFRPGFDCKGKTIKTKKYITKVQRKADISQKETEISEIIKTIPHYDDYFAPILESCDIDIAKIESNEIKKCEFIEPSTQPKKYKTNKIKYIGEKTLEEYIFSLFANKSSKKRKNLEKLITTHVKILTSLNKMSSYGLVHNDIKENNIVCERNGNPILIDFGLSINVNRIEPSSANTPELRIANYKKQDTFFLYDTTYDYWCIDICALSYMFNELGGKDGSWKDATIKQENINYLINDFMTPKDRYIKTLFRPTDKTKYQAYFGKFVGKKWSILFDELIKRKNTWDNYALTVTYIIILMDLHLAELPILKLYAEYMLTILRSTPEERPTTKDTITKLKAIFSNTIPIKQIKQTDIQNNQMAISENIEKTKINQIQGDAKLLQ